MIQKWTNYHQHCYFCDGTDAPEVYVAAALEQNVGSFGFSSHAPLPFPVPWCVKPHHYDSYFQTITQIKQQYADQLPIFVGMEVDYIPNVISPTDEQFRRLDYRIGSVHLVDVGRTTENLFWEIDGPSKIYDQGIQDYWNGDVQSAVTAYYEATRQMLQYHTPDVLGHCDKVKMNNKNRHFSESDPWYRQQVGAMLEVARQSRVIIEVNTRGLYKKKIDSVYPSTWVLELIHDLQIPICLNSDAHRPTEITQAFAQTAELLQTVGFRELYILTKQGWEARPFSAEGIAL